MNGINAIISLIISSVIPIPITTPNIIGNNSQTVNAALDPTNATKINITLKSNDNNNNNNNNMISSILAGVFGVGGAIGGSYLTYRVANRSSQEEKKRDQKYNSSLRDLVIEELQEYHSYLDCFINDLTAIKKQKQKKNYEKEKGVEAPYDIVFNMHDKFLRVLNHYEQTKSIVTSVPLEKKILAFYPKTLVKVESAYQDFNIAITYLKEKMNTYYAGYYNNTVMIKINVTTVENIVANLEETIKLVADE